MVRVVNITAEEWARIQAERGIAGAPVPGAPDLVNIEVETLPHVRFTFPESGGSQAIPITGTGITRIDFYSGDIEYSDGTWGRLPRFLANSPGEHKQMHFLYIYSSQQCKIRTESAEGMKTNWIPVKTDGELSIQSETYQFLEIHATVAGTAVMVVASTDRRMDISQSVGISGVSEHHATIDTNPAVDFIGAIAPAASATAEIAGLSTNSITVYRFSASSAQNLHYRLEFHRSNDFNGDSYLSHMDIDLPADGHAIGAQFVCGYDVAIDVYDEDSLGKLYLRLTNLSGVAKNAGAAGRVIFKMSYKPRM